MSSEATTSSTTLDADLPAFNAWRQALSRFTGLGLTEEDKALQEKELTQEKLTKDCRRCESWRDGVIVESRVHKQMTFALS